jgi:adenylyltransferase/sulfurtransferase
VQFNICSLPNSVHIPIEEFSARLDDIKEMKSSQHISNDNVFVVCRLGNDSQLAVRMMEEQGIEGGRDIIGGLLNWSTRIDPSFPIY